MRAPRIFLSSVPPVFIIGMSPLHSTVVYSRTLNDAADRNRQVNGT